MATTNRADTEAKDAKKVDRALQAMAAGDVSAACHAWHESGER